MEFILKNILRALLFSTSEPLSIKDVQAVITRYHEGLGNAGDNKSGTKDSLSLPSRAGGGQSVMQDLIDQVPTLLTATQIRNAMDGIAQELTEKNEVFKLLQGPSGYRIVVHPDYAEWVRLLREEPKPQKLSAAAMEAVAIVGYRQPITRAEIESIRGVSSDSALSTLLEHELIRVTGRADLPGRPLQYATTLKFLETFGLGSVEELPASDELSPNEISDWIRRSSTSSVELTDADMGLSDEDE